MMIIVLQSLRSFGGETEGLDPLPKDKREIPNAMCLGNSTLQNVSCLHQKYRSNFFRSRWFVCLFGQMIFFVSATITQ